MRVTHVITRLIRGGAQLTLYNLVRGLKARGLDCEVVAGPEEGSEGSILPEMKALGVDLTLLPSLGRETNPLKDAAALLSLARRFSRSGTALVHTHTSKAGLLGGLAARLAGVPAVLYTAQGHIFAEGGAVPSVTDRPGMRPLFLALRRLAEACSSRVVALTPADLEEQVTLGLAPREKYAVIPNGVDPAPFAALPARAEARRALGLPPEAFLVVTVGRLSPEKGQDVLLEALAATHIADRSIQAVLVGDGPMRAALEARAAQADLKGRVHFLGLRKDVPTCLAAADLYVLPSRYEAQGMVVVEAMMAGLPIVASRVGGVPGVLEDGVTGLLVPPADPAALASALRLSPDAGMAERARRQAMATLTVDTMVDSYLRLYRELGA